MDNLPSHGRINCSKCFSGQHVEFDQTKCTEGQWRITANPLAWGNPEAEIVVLGFSKGPTQAGALANTTHDDIAYKGSRSNVAKILAHIGVLDIPPEKDLAQVVSQAISSKSGRFHFGSLIRCTVERYEDATGEWKGSGGRMLDRFVTTDFGQRVANNCVERFLGNLPRKTKLVVMFGLGTKLNYVRASFNLYRAARGGEWKWINDVAYTDGKVIVVHVEHFASQGSLIPEWLSVSSSRGIYGLKAQEAVAAANLPDRWMPAPTPPVRVTKATSMRPPQPEKIKSPSASTTEARISLDYGIDDTESILRVVIDAGYNLTNENKKLAEFCAPGRHTLYVVKTGATLNSIKVMVHPDHSPEVLRRLDGVESIGNKHSFHSNMPRFPKKFKNGKTETTFGWQCKFWTTGNLELFLRQFEQVQL